MAKDDGSAAADKGGESNEVQELTVKLEDGSERKVNADAVLNLIKQGAEATQKTQQVASILSACERYEIPPDKFVEQASAAFDLAYTFQQQGLVDDQGIIVKKSPPEDSQDQDDNLFGQTKQQVPNRQANVQTGIQTALDSLAGTVKQIQDNQDYLARVHLEGEIKKANPDFSEGDIVRTLAMAKAKGVPVTKATEIVAKERIETEKAQRAFYAKEFNVDLETFDKNKLNQQDAEGGAGPSFEGKRFSFKGGKDTVDPKEAMRQHFAASSVKQ